MRIALIYEVVLSFGVYIFVGLFGFYLFLLIMIIVFFFLFCGRYSDKSYLGLMRTVAWAPYFFLCEILSESQYIRRL